MDHFFRSVASLMSRNLRSVVYSSIGDFVQFIDMYKLGNDFTVPFVRCLPILPQPVVLTVVRMIQVISMGMRLDLFLVMGPGARFWKVLRTFRGRKAIFEIANRSFWKADPLTCFQRK